VKNSSPNITSFIKTNGKGNFDVYFTPNKIGSLYFNVYLKENSNETQFQDSPFIITSSFQKKRNTIFFGGTTLQKGY